MPVSKVRLPGVGYTSPDEIQDEVSADAWRKPDVQARIPRWIAQKSNDVDDAIRSKYKVPFPNYPVGPATLRTITTYLVVHQIYVFLGLDRSDEDSNMGSYWNMAQELLKQIRAGDLQLDDTYEVPTTDADGNVTGAETVVVLDTNRPLYSAQSTNPLSIANQNREFGPPLRSLDQNPYTTAGIAGGRNRTGRDMDER